MLAYKIIIPGHMMEVIISRTGKDRYERLLALLNASLWYVGYWNSPVREDCWDRSSQCMLIHYWEFDLPYWLSLS